MLTGSCRKTLVEETRCRWEDNIKMNPKEIQWDSINWIEVAGSTEHDNELKVQQNAAYFPTS